MIHDITAGLKEKLKKEMTSAYVGIDSTADSLHIGHLISVMMLKHFQLTDQEYTVSSADLMNNTYLVVQKNKKNYFISEAV